MNPKTINWKNHLLLFLIAVLFALFYCWSTSPIIYSFEGDSSIFMTMGKLLLDGKIPYIDFFDHKGPVIIFVEALGQIIIPNQTGIFIFEIINLYITLIIIVKITKLFSLDAKRTWMVIGVFLIFLSKYIGTGNNTEELSLIPLFISLYIGCRYFIKKTDISKVDGFILGVCFSYLFWLRLNNAGPLCGVVLFLFISTIINKNYRSTINLVIFFIIGQLPLLIAFSAYFLYHNAFYDLMYATFLFNFKYAESSYQGIRPRFRNFNLIFLFILLCCSFLYYKQTKNKETFVFSACLLISSFFAVNMGGVFDHYYILYCPLFIFTACLLFNKNYPIYRNKYFTYTFILLVSAYFIFSIVKFPKRSKRQTKIWTTHRENAQKILNNIPESELDKTFYFQVNSDFYPLVNLLPNYKYFILQEWHAEHDHKIIEDIEALLNSQEKPLWVIIEWYGRNDLNSGIYDILDRDYDFINEDDKEASHKLFRLKVN